MHKTDFLINLIKKESEGSKLFLERWYRPTSFQDGSKNNDYWLYAQPGIDCIQPEITLLNDGIVEFTNFDESDQPIKLTYQEFLDTYQELI